MQAIGRGRATRSAVHDGEAEPPDRRSGGRRPAVGAALALVLAVAGCGDPSRRLLVDVRTDLVPVQELAAVEVEPIGEPALRREVAPGEDWIDGVRVAELLRGERVVRLSVRALGPDDEIVVERPISVTLTTTDQAVTVLLSRDCRGVECGDLARPSCRAGSCVEEACVEEAGCAAECADAADCAPGAACSEVRCVEGACVYAPLPEGAACGPSSYCDAELGCRTPDDPALRLHYSFEARLEGGARDSTGGGRDAVCTACPTPGEGGPRGAHVCFDASPQWLEVPFEPRFAEPGPRTVAAWIRAEPTGRAAPRSVFGKPFGSETGNSWELTLSREILFIVRPLEASQIHLAGAEAPFDTWLHVAGTWDPDSGRARLWVDGEPVRSATLSPPLEYDESPLFIGADRNSEQVGFGFLGCIDDVRYYERALSPAEIAALAAR